MSLLDIKIHDEIDLYIHSCFLLEPEVNFENSLKNNQKEQVSIHNEINNLYEKTKNYFEKSKKKENIIILRYFKKIIINYKLLEVNKINKKEFIAKIEEI